VAITAIAHVHPQWIDEDEFWKRPRSFLASQKLPEGLAGRLDELRVPDSLSEYRDHFKRLAGGIRT
jgi:hypothetical protein